ncbi:MAG TPA: branched-chain amino acid ABC transporter permease [Burkholderiales bacterium]|nr:branched-chain amino acid ABC transporter permease [Burkholderiales bacterium]
MTPRRASGLLYAGVLAAGIGAPLAFPDYTFQLAMLWMMILFALTWDIVGGQMGYNSLGNIVFFGAGMYVCALTQIGLYYDIGEYTAAFGAIRVDFTMPQYLTGLALGLCAAAVAGVLIAIAFGRIVFGLRGPYFAIGTLGVALAAGELVGTWDWVGGGGGISLPVYPGEPQTRSLLLYALAFVTAAAVFAFLRWLYSTRFGLAINAIRDDEQKAEAMGLHTTRYKTAAWAISGFFLAITGGIFGNMTGFIEPLEVAFPTVTFGVFMVLMVLLGGKGTLWGPVIGATIFHVIKEVTWTYLLGWQWITLGALIIVNVIFFQQGILGWARERWPARFGIRVDEPAAAADEESARASVTVLPRQEAA